MDRRPTTEIKEVSAKACPFCGGTDIRTIRTPKDQWATMCYPMWDGCGVRTDYKFSSQAARIAWDRRADS